LTKGREKESFPIFCRKKGGKDLFYVCQIGDQEGFHFLYQGKKGTLLIISPSGRTGRGGGYAYLNRVEGEEGKKKRSPRFIILIDENKKLQRTVTREGKDNSMEKRKRNLFAMPRRAESKKNSVHVSSLDEKGGKSGALAVFPALSRQMEDRGL